MAKTYLSSDLKLEGDIKSQGDIEIDGAVKGQVAAKSVNVLGAGLVDGSVSSDSLAVEGKVDGSVNTNDLAIAATGQIKADVVYQSIATAKGAKVEGTLKTK